MSGARVPFYGTVGHQTLKAAAEIVRNAAYRTWVTPALIAGGAAAG